MKEATLICGDALNRLSDLPEESVQCVVTSPPYWGLRDYGTAAWKGGDMECNHRGPPAASKTSILGSGPGRRSKVREEGFVPYRDTCGKCGAHRVDDQLGLEAMPEEYTARLVAVFHEVWRVLRKDGTLWLNLGDTFAANRSYQVTDSKHVDVGNEMPMRVPVGLKPKDLVGIPWRVAFALQEDGWWLRSDIIWSKPNAMPESVTDRPTKSYEHMFLLAKSQRYFYDHEAIKERSNTTEKLRNNRDVWTINNYPYSQAHFATFPPKLIEPCIRAGTSDKGCCIECGSPWKREGVEWAPTCNHSNQEIEPCTVLDPFTGSGTTGMVALELERNFIGIELNPEYILLSEERISSADSDNIVDVV